MGLSVTDNKAEKLKELLPSIVDETLKQIFREEGAKVIYSYIENKCHLKQEEIIEKPEVFSAGLKRLLTSGAFVIEKTILKCLYSKLGLEYEEKKGYEFSDYIEELREKCRCL
jgi:biotin-(acetyl-CoA carboxylase) ligase